MKKLIIATSIAFTLGLSVTQIANAKTTEAELADDKHQNELIGFGSGAVAGALVAGPAGAIVGGIFGLFIADDVNEEAQIELSNEQLAQANYSLAQQKQSVVALQSELQTLQEQQMLQLVSYEEESNESWLNDLSHFETNLQFKTASFSIADTYKNQLDSLANILSTYPQLTIKLTGFADQRGDSDYNQALSQQRADAVADYLSKQNVAASQIKIVAKGEEVLPSDSALTASSLNGNNANTAQATSTEDLFFSRRVNISLLTPKQQMTASN